VKCRSIVVFKSRWPSSSCTVRIIVLSLDTELAMWRSAVEEERERYGGAQGFTLLARAIASD
jgi:hypothetical protein